MKAIEREVGGNHYNKCRMQPYEYIVRAKLTFSQGNIAKYITRYKDKNGKQDIEKCVHYAQLAKEFQDYGEPTDLLQATTYCTLNELSKEQSDIIMANAMYDYDRVEDLCTKLIAKEYGA